MYITVQATHAELARALTLYTEQQLQSSFVVEPSAVFSLDWLAMPPCSVETRPARLSGALRLDLGKVCFRMVVGFSL